MLLTIALAQTGFPVDGDVLAQVESCAQKAQDAGARLLVFPENLMQPRDDLAADDLRELSEPLDGPFASGVADVAARHGLWIAFTMYEGRVAGASDCDADAGSGTRVQPYNTAVVVDDQGVARGTYRKTHLYDAHGVRESDRLSYGEALPAPIDAPFGKLGIAICYDLRFPEVARAMALSGCKLVLYPAAWHAGPEKMSHWETLLRARAIENELFVAGVCHAGKRYVGHSLVADPLGRVLAVGADATPDGAPEDLVICTIDLDDVDAARDAMPVLEHRRPGLYC